MPRFDVHMLITKYGNNNKKATQSTRQKNYIKNNKKERKKAGLVGSYDKTFCFHLLLNSNKSSPRHLTTAVQQKIEGGYMGNTKSEMIKKITTGFFYKLKN